MEDKSRYNYLRTVHTTTGKIRYFAPQFTKTKTFLNSDYKIIDQIPNDPALIRPKPTTLGGRSTDADPKAEAKDMVSKNEVNDIVAQAVAVALAAERERNKTPEVANKPKAEVSDTPVVKKIRPTKKQKTNG